MATKQRLQIISKSFACEIKSNITNTKHTPDYPSNSCNFYSLTFCCDFLLLVFGEHPAGSALTCYWFINNFMMDVYENVQLEFLYKATLYTGKYRMLHHNPVTISSMKLLFEATDLFSIYLDDGVDFSLRRNSHLLGDFIFEIVNYSKVCSFAFTTELRFLIVLLLKLTRYTIQPEVNSRVYICNI